MNADAIKRFLMFLSSAVRVERGQLYQLVQSAEASYCLRDIESQREIGLLLQSFTYPFNQVGKYYESIYLYRSGQHGRAREMLESVAESAPVRYRSRALLSLSAVEESLGCFEESIRLRLQASTCDDLVTMIEAQRGIAVLRGVEGDHRAALRDLERLMPLAHIIGRRGHPSYFAFLNSYALELSERGRIEEAGQVANIVAASPFITRYLEWQDTLSEVESKRRRSSFVAVAFPKRESRTIRDSRIRAVIDFMETNLRRKISLSDMASVANLSQSHLSRLFNIHTGFSPSEYLIRLRVEKARELLRRGSLSVKEVMALVGFNAKSNFARQFKRYFGIAPSKYRRRILARP
jgi:AraC-like DNA-binding protein